VIRDNPLVRARALTALVVLTVLLAGCRRGNDAPPASEAFCKAAVKYEERIQRGAGVDEQIRLVERIVRTAPRKIEADAQTFLDALRRVRTDPSIKDDPKVKKAVAAVERYAAKGCGFYQRPGGGF
jgi:hypothetical protein